MANAATIERTTQAYQAEQDAWLLYERLANEETDPKRRCSLRKMAAEERTHAGYWAEKLTQIGAPVPETRLSLRSRILAGLATRFGVRAIAQFLNLDEREGAVGYEQSSSERAFAGQERNHARVFAAMASGRDVATSEAWHRAGTVNLRAAIFGINDGLVSNLSLVVGVAAAQPAPEMVLVAGIAGLLAGAFSMAGGEYISVRSQREVMEHQLDLERIELAENPEAERQELTRIYQRKGIPAADADRLARSMLADERVALDTLAREELGLNPNDLGSPLWAAGSSFVSFAIGAVIPILPYLFIHIPTAALVISVVASGVTLFLVGALLALLTGRNALVSGARMVAVGGAAAAVTYAVGRVLGVAIGG